jgi:hypothetical protein
MGYVRKVINIDEKLLSISRPHWIYLFEGLLCFVGLAVAGLVLDYYFYLYVGSHAIRFDIDLWFVKFNEIRTPIPWIFSFTGFAIFYPLFLAYISAEIGLTDQRIIYKRNLIFIEIEQVDLEDIRAEHVSHGWLGWLLGYGRIRLDCRFIDDVRLPAIRKPYKLIKAMHTARMRHPNIDYTNESLHENLERIKHKEAEKSIYKIQRLVKEGFLKAA